MTREAKRSNQKREICVRTMPLPGRPLAMMTSKAEMRSEATMRRPPPEEDAKPQAAGRE